MSESDIVIDSVDADSVYLSGADIRDEKAPTGPIEQRSTKPGGLCERICKRRKEGLQRGGDLGTVTHQQNNRGAW